MLPSDSKSDAIIDWTLALVANGHTPVLDEDGVLDTLAYYANNGNGAGHNGPACATCRAGWCWHCHGPAGISPCSKPLDHKTSDV